MASGETNPLIKSSPERQDTRTFRNGAKTHIEITGTLVSITKDKIRHRIRSFISLLKALASKTDSRFDNFHYDK